MLNQLKMLLAGLGQGESGQTLVEYALIIALVAVLLAGALLTLNGQIGASLVSSAGSL